MFLAFHQFYMVENDFEEHFDTVDTQPEKQQHQKKDKVWLINEPDACKEVIINGGTISKEINHSDRHPKCCSVWRQLSMRLNGAKLFAKRGARTPRAKMSRYPFDLITELLYF